MNNSRYNLRSSAQQPVAPSFYPSSTTGGLSSSSLLSTQPSFQAQQQQPSQYIEQQKQPFMTETTQPQLPTADMIPTHYQQGQGQGQINLGGPAATAPFLQDFTLVAEAVKRVQMDAVMTEMESITL
ncbi:hypothetical protein TSTA_029510 [Talaromyces stipitatus ATCC 10500]|uniref:Uncharacterized protein n=1 Tax=Talaromyces stipitatus (strain ATCC 10500 / CBS 375.48 / QM 6759 / NRRL 1006) TaxID=441959 RepID=B8M569_TALSN|nr:uncharacterized protein TSTA_029510 [Talaromyces stipitatus ATCC 10500]EED19675.1 hypothetical protein TSTA_029510 [Talaromyces stipitatus ATCC 10500]